MLAGKRLIAAHVADVTEPTEFQSTLAVDDTLTVQPAASPSAQHLAFNHGYSVYVDNTGAGAAGNRIWIDCPDDGQLILGPRATSSTLADARIRTDATTASAANMHIDSTSYKISRSTSSLTYKQDVEDLELDTAAVRRLRPVRFHDKGEMAADPDSARWYVGLIAEDVHDLGLTEFVTYRDGQPDALMYDRLCVALIQWNRELEGRLGALEAKIEKLSGS